MLPGQFSSRRTIASTSLLVVVSIVVPQMATAVWDASSPQYAPEQFSLPATAREVVSKRTASTATFRIGSRTFAQVSGIAWAEPPVCRSTLCSVVSAARSLVPNVLAASEGPNSPVTIANDSSEGSGAWVNPENAGTSDDVYATWLSSNLSYYLKATNFGFAIPGTATVDGILVEVEKKANANGVSDSLAYIVQGDVIMTTENKAIGGFWSTSEAYSSYGGSSDLWSQSWTPSDINATGFGFALLVSRASGQTASVDHIRITVTYTEAAPVPFFSWWSLPLLLGGLFVILRREGVLTQYTLYP